MEKAERRIFLMAFNPAFNPPSSPLPPIGADL
jgi:hypothetical protein